MAIAWHLPHVSWPVPGTANVRSAVAKGTATPTRSFGAATTRTARAPISTRKAKTKKARPCTTYAGPLPASRLRPLRRCSATRPSTAYDFNREALAQVTAKTGPTVGQVIEPLDHVPAEWANNLVDVQTGKSLKASSPSGNADRHHLLNGGSAPTHGAASVQLGRAASLGRQHLAQPGCCALQARLKVPGTSH
jgi:hypothetical protein